MQLIPAIAEHAATYAEWRHALHQCPQTAYEEVFASDFVAKKLAEWGIEVHRGLGKTGVVGVLRGKNDHGKKIGLRADMDALDIREQTGLPYCSTCEGKMHACGHDGHTAALLAAAQYLAQSRDFCGTVHFIFQPAEEGARGANAMIADGLFKKFPCDNLFALHNWPDLPVGKAGLRAGPMLASDDRFSFSVKGKGGHAAYPHNFTDTVLCAAHIVTGLQSLVARNIHPLDAGVISVATIHAGTVANVMPESVALSGTVRSLRPEVRRTLQDGIFRIVENICGAFGTTVSDYVYQPVIEVTANSPRETEICAGVLEQILGSENVDAAFIPTMGAEDFGGMLQEVPGCYVVLGNRDDGHGAKLHTPQYDFNDALLPIAATYFVKLVETVLATQSREEHHNTFALSTPRAS